MKKVLILFMALGLTWSITAQNRIFTIGDSTMADKPNPDSNPERGWAQMLPSFFNDQVQIFNKAVNGRSSKSFRDEGLWQKVYDSLQTGDYVFIQFGHNDQKEKDSTRYTNPNTTFRNNLIRYVNETREKGSIPILFTPISRRSFNEYGVLIDTHGMYGMQIRWVAQEMNVPLFDLQYYSEILELEYGLEGSKKLHLHYLANEHPYYPNGKSDDTHLSILGATEMATIVMQQIKIKIPALISYIL